MKYNEIRFVKCHTFEGMPYCWFVGHKSGRVSDSVEYINRDEQSRTVIEEYPAEWLPKAVQKYIEKHESHSFEDDLTTYTIWREEWS